MDRARVTGPQIAWNKAFTAAGHKTLDPFIQSAPNGPHFQATKVGIQWSFGAGPRGVRGRLSDRGGRRVVGGIGLSGGNGEQDITCGLGGPAGPAGMLAPNNHRVLVQPDIKM